MTATPAAPSPIHATAIPDARTKTLFAHAEGMIDAAAPAAPVAAVHDDVPGTSIPPQPLRRLIIVDENWW